MTPEIRFYGRLLVRRAPAMLLLFLVCAAIGLVLASRLPTIYESGARMLMQSPRISEELAASTVQVSPLEEARFQEQSLMTRPNLLDIAHDFDVFEDIRDLAPDDVVAAMREATVIAIEGGGDRRTGPAPVTMSVTFQARTGEIAAAVVNEYVTRIESSYLEDRRGIATQTLDFFEREEERLSTELALQSARISEFQREHADALPADQDFRLQRLSLLQERLAAAERERRAFLETRTRTIEVFERSEGRVISSPAGSVLLTPDQRELQDLQDQMGDLLAVFSETAPQVTQLQRRIDALEDRIERQAALPQTDPEIGVDETNGDNPTAPLLALQLAEIDARIDQIQTLIEDTNAEIAALEVAIAQSPQNAIELEELQRDYATIQAEYDDVRQSLSQARVGESVEGSDTGRRIVLIEPPAVPNAPSSPNRPVIAAGGFGAGLALAAALFLLLELLNRSVRRPVEITKALGITPLATVPYLESAGRRFYRRALRVAAVLVVLAGVPAALWAIDTYYLPLDLLAERLMNRLGIA